MNKIQAILFTVRGRGRINDSINFQGEGSSREELFGGRSRFKKGSRFVFIFPLSLSSKVVSSPPTVAGLEVISCATFEDHKACLAEPDRP